MDVLTPKDLPAYVRQVAPNYGVDPAAALSMAQHEGMVGGQANPGDGNTSFGPWQLHVGGALPSNIGALGPEMAQQWAWSPDGINYALKAMSDSSRNPAARAKGLVGRSAVDAIATWEASTDIPGQAQRAWDTYTGWLGTNIPIALAGFINIITGGGVKKRVGGGPTDQTDPGGNAIVPVPDTGTGDTTTVPGTTHATGGGMPQDIRLGSFAGQNIGIPSGLVLGLLGLCLLLIGAIIFGYGGAARANINMVGAQRLRGPRAAWQ